MGISSSKAETCEALRLCKERKKFIKQAIDSRYNLAAAHVVYVESLQNIGIALRNFAESEVSLESSSTTKAEKPPNPTPSPPQIDRNGATGGGGGGDQSGSPSPVPNVRLSYMKSSGTGVVTVNVSSNCNKVYEDDVENLPFTMSPPRPPPPPRFSWDYFDPTDGSFRFMSHEEFQVNFNNTNVDKQFPDHLADLGESATSPESVKRDENAQCDDDLVATDVKNDEKENCDLNDGCLTEEETEDSSEFISTHHHGGKDFLSSIKDIENHFLQASRAGNEVSRMLEANKIQVSYSDAKGSSTTMGSSSLFLRCFKGETTLILQEPTQTTKVITWKRSTSLRSSSSSSSSHPLGTLTKDDNENNFLEEFCMIAGSHSSTLDRLYAWERKLYDEVKASESIRKEYDRKCDQLRHQFAKDLKPHVIDKTRSLAKDLHSRIRVALHTVDSISKRIEKMRDEELQPQLVELIQGLMKMWKSMLECHHAQYTTISSSHNSTISRSATHQNETKNQIMTNLQHEIECFASSFTDLTKCYTAYIESINNWLQHCITLPKERAKSRRAFSPRRAVAPPIFVICRDWLAGVRALPAQKLGDAIKDLLSHVKRVSMEECENKEICDEKDEGVMGLDLSKIQSGLTKVLDRLTKFSEESLKMYQEIKENCETAGNVYLNYRPPIRAFSV